MEEKDKAQVTEEPKNPTGEDEEVKADDLTDEGNDSKDASAKEGEDGDSEEEPKKEETKGKALTAEEQREQDRKNAERRRAEKARKEAKEKEREEQIRRQAVFEVKSGQVTSDELSALSLDKVETEDQLYLVESLRKAKSEGAENPEAEAYKALFRKQSEEKAKAVAKAKADKEADDARKAMVASDQKAFREKFGKTTGDVIKNEKEFMDIFGNVIDADKGNFTECYSIYTQMKQGTRDASKKEGSFPTSTQGNAGGSTEGETDEEFLKRFKAQYGR